MTAGARQRRGFTFVEVMIVVAIVGVLAALAVLGVRRYLASSKTAEAKQNVGAIARNAAVQYERERDISQLLLGGGVTAANTHLLCTTATPVPANFTLVQGTKYQPSTAPGTDFMTGTHTAGWQCLGFAITNPTYYQYHYVANVSNGGANYLSQVLGVSGAPTPTGDNAFEAAARGDLDGDGTSSVFTRSGEVHNDQMVVSTQVFVDNEYD